MEELRMHLAWRWFTGLGFDQEIPHHSTFSKNRHGRLHESKLFEQLFEQIVKQCVEVGLVRGDNLSVDGSFVEANAAKESRIPREQLGEAAEVNQTVRQYLAELEEQNPVEEPVHEQDQVSTTDPDSTYATKGGTPARLGYYDNYLVDNHSCVIVGVQATAARMSQETVAAQDMLTRFAQWQGRKPVSVAADTTYGNGEFLQWRFDKEPDYRRSEREALRRVKELDFQSLIKKELRTADALMLNDTEKGFLSKSVLIVIGNILNEVNRERSGSNLPALITIADPKRNWAKFRGLPISVLKSNHIEASSQVELPFQQATEPEGLQKLAKRLCDRGFTNHFPQIVVTLGHGGAALLRRAESGGELYRIPKLEAPNSKFNVATHCGDIFGSALLLALVAGESTLDAAIFANYVASLQYAKRTGTKVTREEVMELRNIQRLKAQATAALSEPTVLKDKKESLVTQILRDLGKEIDYAKHYYCRAGRTSELVVGPKFSNELDRLADLLQRGRIVWLYGDSRAGKGAIIKNLSVFFPEFDASQDCYAAVDALASEASLDKALDRAEQRRTCLVLDEIQGVDQASITRLLTAFPSARFDKPFCLILAGHMNQVGNFADLSRRAQLFEVRPYADDARRFDLPYLIAMYLKKADEASIPHRPRQISALALRELLRFDYEENWHSLELVLNESCRGLTGDTLEWRHLKGLKKGAVEPVIPELNYTITLIR